MNRIKELREAAGLTLVQLAQRVGTADSTISRLGHGERKLTVEWMQRISEALGVSPTDLIASMGQEAQADIEPAVIEGLGKAALAAAKHGVRFYKVIGNSVEQTGIVPGDVIGVDHIENANQAAVSGDVVVAKIRGILVLRHFLQPNLLVTNYNGANYVVMVGDRTLGAEIIIGIVMRD